MQQLYLTLESILTMARPSVSNDAVTRLRRLAASIDPERCESFEERLTVVLDRLEDVEAELDQLKAQIRAARQQAVQEQQGAVVSRSGSGQGQRDHGKLPWE